MTNSPDDNLRALVNLVLGEGKPDKDDREGITVMEAVSYLYLADLVAMEVWDDRRVTPFHVEYRADIFGLASDQVTGAVEECGEDIPRWATHPWYPGDEKIVFTEYRPDESVAGRTSSVQQNLVKAVAEVSNETKLSDEATGLRYDGEETGVNPTDLAMATAPYTLSPVGSTVIDIDYDRERLEELDTPYDADGVEPELVEEETGAGLSWSKGSSELLPPSAEFISAVYARITEYGGVDPVQLCKHPPEAKKGPWMTKYIENRVGDVPGDLGQE